MNLMKLRRIFLSFKKDSHRLPMQVTRAYINPTSGAFPVCPRCDTPFEIEYQAYCGSCGQCLGWEMYTDILEESKA